MTKKGQSDESKAVVAALQQWAGGEMNLGFIGRWRWRIFYTLKALVCIGLGLRYQGEEDWQRIVESVAVFDITSESEQFGAPETAASYKVLNVGTGVWGNWYYEIKDESNWARLK